ncbi:sulfurtransferase TusA family protein (plasmid) [Pseudomonas amygdali pv. lachrymans]|uniref:Sulfurtransferase TusA family protein n=1 Tax=Pseudomonas syringae pv. maculicola str. ES4326 TaxID=629265 RepID=A0A8T8CAL9_PSEYM|nr:MULTISPECIES: sulfurtransferase TusA family protein [Pseudomonas syringae group]QHF00703.1 sulfurtransferase TusA family protein [Pseudomonas syringae pv. maculicola str. ES4326]RMM39431.1 hypothetical protein ALQ79_200650 [Pseudomonas amygdali pv. lachrymans]UBZ00312.1 sulfurtransferase TusA family protein [Pseudomonas cannabina pv. alisalensis]WIO61573.1 sulfurtransferase TusA family protein [Pseudomonas amygdali pv. lachrymans]
MTDTNPDPYQDPDVFVDARGLQCPIPILKARLECNRMSDGQILHVLSTDAGSKRDFKTFAQQTGHELIGEAEEGDVYGFWLRIRRGE